MEAEFKDAEVFKKMMDTIGSLMSDVSIDFNEEGFAIKAMDPANIAMVLFEAKRSIFSNFNIEKPVKISVSLDDLNGILRLAKKEDKIKMSDSKNRLIIDINGKNKQHFGIPLIDENYTAQKVPQLKFTSEVTVLSSKERTFPTNLTLALSSFIPLISVSFITWFSINWWSLRLLHL